MNLKPLQDWAVIRRSEAEERTAGGIIIPDTAKEKPLEGMIVAIGPGTYKLEKGKEKEKKKKFIPTVLKPGQKVIYQKYAEREVELGGEVITLVREEDILGTVEDYVVSERRTHALEEKREGSVAIREKAHVPAVTPAVASGKKPSAAVEKTPAGKPAEKKAASKTLSPKKEKPAEKKKGSSRNAVTKKKVKKAVTKPSKATAGKVAKKSAPAKKKVKPAVKKATAVKKTVKKVAAKKPAVKKAAAKKTAKPAPKKVSSKKIAVKKTAKKTLATKGKKK